jgi:hypothetical protein
MIKKNTEAPSDTNKEAGIEVNVEKTQYMFMSRHPITGFWFHKRQGISSLPECTIIFSIGLCSVELVSYTSPSIIRTLKCRRLQQAGHMTRMVETRNVHRILVGKPLVKCPLEARGGDWRTTERWILGGQVERIRGGWNWFRIMSNGCLW